MRDDLAKLPLPKSAKRYARMKASDLGDNWSKKVDMYMDMAADLTNQSKEGFKNKDASGKVKHAFKESAESIVKALLGENDDLLRQMGNVAAKPVTLYMLIRDAIRANRQNGWTEAIDSALKSVGVDHYQLATLVARMIEDVEADEPQHAPQEYTRIGEVIAVINNRLQKALPKLSSDKRGALVKAVRDELEILAGKRYNHHEEIRENDDLLNQMGDIADSPLHQYQHAREALNWVFGEGQGQVAAIAAALQSCGFVGDDGPIYVGHEETLADLIGMYLDDVSTGNSVEEACDAIQKVLQAHAERLGIADGSVWALMKIFREEAQGIADTAEEYNQEMDDEIGAGEENPDEVLQTTDRVVEESSNNDDLLSQMGDVAVEPVLYQRALQALQSTFHTSDDPVSAVANALAAVGALDQDRKQLRLNTVMSLPNFLTLHIVDKSFEAVEKLLRKYAPMLGDGAVAALMRVFQEEAENIRQMWLTESHIKESIKAAAVKCHDGTVIAGPPGADHIACCMMANQQGKSWDDEGLGFVTHDDRFVDRNEAEIEGMRHGQLRPEISDPGMVHARDFYWNESRGGYRYETCCVNADGGDISDMVDSAVDVTYEEFMRNVPLDQIFASGIGYGYDWPPAKLIVAGIDPHEVGRQGLTLKKDWHVSYHKSTYQGRPCYFMCHSAIEYVFVKD